MFNSEFVVDFNEQESLDFLFILNSLRNAEGKLEGRKSAAKSELKDRPVLNGLVLPESGQVGKLSFNVEKIP
ncbi:MAG: hypothetical protein E7256_08375 [Lachnospiraceae bacterium]|nr:hypothetical protein [Lachnospiraceae bacterium]